jgi:hypothetical protein
LTWVDLVDLPVLFSKDTQSHLVFFISVVGHTLLRKMVNEFRVHELLLMIV